MNWNNVKLIFQREMRDQLRDRRTLFLIAVLPLLLYPLMGMSFFQMTQFLRKQAAKVLVIGADELQGVDWLPQLLDGRRFDAGLFDSQGGGRENLQLIFPSDLIEESADGSSTTGSITLEEAHGQLASGEVQVVLYFPPAFAARMQKIQEKQ